MKKSTLLIIIGAVIFVVFFLWLYFLSEVVFFSSQCERLCSTCQKKEFFGGVSVDCMLSQESRCNINTRCSVENFKCKYKYDVDKECKTCFDSCKNSSDSGCTLDCMTKYGGKAPQPINTENEKQIRPINITP